MQAWEAKASVVVGGGSLKGEGGRRAEPQRSEETPLRLEYLELETRVAVPASPAAGARSFVQRVEFKFT